MLQRNPEFVSPKSIGPRSTAISPAELLSAASSLARRRVGIIALIFFLSLLCGATYLSVATPKFLAKASLIIDTRKTPLFTQQQQQSPIEGPIDSVTVDSQIEILRSQTIATAVVKDLHLTSDPEFVGAKPGVAGGVEGGDDHGTINRAPSITI